MKVIDYKKTQISFDESYHVYKNNPVYNKRFKKVMSFHPPGVAAAWDEDWAYHINIAGEPIYPNRFIKTFGYYQDLASVITADGWCHIDLKGNIIYNQRYDWTGNFQENRCVVKENNKYFHIDIFGTKSYEKEYAYTGDYKYGIAVAYKKPNSATHIDLEGNEIHGKEFHELGIFHKGFAVAKDENGYFHIDKEGCPLYDLRFCWCEPFYNEKAFVRGKDGKLGVISEDGNFQEII